MSERMTPRQAAEVSASQFLRYKESQDNVKYAQQTFDEYVQDNMDEDQERAEQYRDFIKSEPSAEEFAERRERDDKNYDREIKRLGRKAMQLGYAKVGLDNTKNEAEKFYKENSDALYNAAVAEAALDDVKLNLPPSDSQNPAESEK